MTSTETLKMTALGEREIAMTRAFAAPRDRVFDAWTKPELLKQWLGPRIWSLPACDIDLKVGGNYRMLWRAPNGTEMGMRGTYREIAPPGRLVATELFDEDWTGGETRVTTVFAEEDGKTSATTTVLYASREARDAVLKMPIERGVAESYDRLDEFLASTPAR